MNRPTTVPAELIDRRPDLTPCPALPGAVIHAAQMENA
jgi:hypothetical protein